MVSTHDNENIWYEVPIDQIPIVIDSLIYYNQTINLGTSTTLILPLRALHVVKDVKVSVIIPALPQMFHPLQSKDLITGVCKWCFLDDYVAVFVARP